uniref:Purple acid phosphatase n=1 Tax=Globisporangium ultimum (strain ATCC 200006 / CBS 805.95 / DAOM BR144) TaxID=431595 RepID=K3WNF6_GLOUD
RTKSLWLGLSALLAFAASTASAQRVLQDTVCSWSLTEGCHSEVLCSYQLKFGDFTPSQACCARPEMLDIPQLLHLAYAGSPSDSTGMTISWATYQKASDSAVWIGLAESSLEIVDKTLAPSASYYSDDDYSLFQNHATMRGLKPHTKYFYKVGSARDLKLQSPLNTFTMARPAFDTSAVIIAVHGGAGDGDNAADTIKYVDSLGDKIDFVYHVGDISYTDDGFLVPLYALGFFYEDVWDQWINEMTPIMSKVPYMVVVGNHEAECHSPNCQISKTKKDKLDNYTAYNARFKMPSKESGGVLNMWHSFDHGRIHFTADYSGAPKNELPLTHSNGNFGDQLVWLEADLKKAAANRGNIPEADKDGVPTGDSKIAQEAFEELFIKYGVDVVVTSHYHFYERHLPIARGKAIMDGVSADKKTYANPKAPVYLTAGAAGNIEDHGKMPKARTSWSAASDYKIFGISMLTATREALEWTFVASKTEKELDRFKITKR